jgi:hypothetical protein
MNVVIAANVTVKVCIKPELVPNWLVIKSDRDVNPKKCDLNGISM